MELQLKRLEQAPLLYAEVIPNVRRALLPRFPYGLFYAVRGDLVHVLAVLHDVRNPSRWPKPANPALKRGQPQKRGSPLLYVGRHRTRIAIPAWGRNELDSWIKRGKL